MLGQVGVKIIGRIDLPERKKRPEEYLEFLKNKMSDIANSVNKEFSCDLLGRNAEILMSKSPSLEVDLNEVSKCENNWAREQGRTVDDWRRNKDRSRSTIAEMAITATLHRILGERFIVARASKIDDYKGVDNVLIDKETGAVVCGFDDVLGHIGDDGGEIKDEKIKKKLLLGGSSLKYGATIINNEIVRKQLENVPTFFLSLSKEELEGILEDLKNNTVATENEKKLISKMVASLEEQNKEANNIAINNNLRNNLNNFTKSLEVIKNYLNK